MANYTLSYLQQRSSHISNLKDELLENGNFANYDDVLTYKKLSTEGKTIKETIKQEFNLEHDMKKRVLDSFQ